MTRWFELLELSNLEELLASTEMNFKEMLNPHPTEQETPTSTKKKKVTLNNLCEDLRMTKELCNFFVKIC